MRISATFAPLALLVPWSYGQSDDNGTRNFIVPKASDCCGSYTYSNNSVYVVGQQLQLEWADNISLSTEWTIMLWQQDTRPGFPGSTASPLPVFMKAANATDPQTFNWTVSYQQFSNEFSNVYYLTLNYGNPSVFSTVYFNMTDYPPDGPAGGSSDSKALIGVAVSLGILCALLVAFIVYQSRHNRHREYHLEPGTGALPYKPYDVISDEAQPGNDKGFDTVHMGAEF